MVHCIRILVLCSCWMSLTLWLGCSTPEQSCPDLPTATDILATEIDTSHCCEALSICCKEVPEGEDKKKCLEDTRSGALASCQARYYSLTSFSLCKPVYVRDYPHLKPKKRKQ